MKNDSTHPARSADFLSRLHDGELTAAERAHFESHRAHCADCRAAAAEFERALSLFRASMTSPAAPDLPARILRKLQSTTRRRPPFGVVFGINLKWAAAFSTAIIAVIIGSAVVLQRDAARKLDAGRTPIPVVLQPQAAARQEPAPSEEAARRDSPPAAKARTNARKEAPPAPASAPALDSVAASADERFASSPPPQSAGSVELKARPLARSSSPARAEEPDRSVRIQEAPPSGLLEKSERAGGEGAATSSLAFDAPAPPARLVVVPLDGQGSVPQIVSAGAAELLAGLRGRQYLLFVEASGRVLEASANGGKSLHKRARANDALEKAPAVPPSVWGLRFRPTDRARRLLLRVE